MPKTGRDDTNPNPFTRYAQVIMDEIGDYSQEGIQEALSLAQIFYNIAVLSELSGEKEKIKQKMTDEFIKEVQKYSSEITEIELNCFADIMFDKYYEIFPKHQPK